MALPSATISFPSTSMATFHEHLKQSKRTLALLGAGLSASSGLSTFRGVGNDGLWEGHKLADLATPTAFEKDPRLVWRFYQERRKQALEAEPNRAHTAIAKLAHQLGKERCTVLSMNIDGLCTRAGHPADQLLELHGNIFDLKCSNTNCTYVENNNFNPELLPSTTSTDSADIALPTCPTCTSLLRPSIVWFNEPLPRSVVSAADSWISDSSHIDLVLVIGTTAQVWPASGYVDAAIEKGARVAMVNIDRGDLVPGSGELGLTHRDWFFVGDSVDVVPEMLEPVIRV